MDRPEPGLVKWSPTSSVDSFAHINLQHRVVQLYEPTGHARTGHFDYERLARHDDFPPLTTYDWSPQNPGLLAVGTGSGVVNILRIDDGTNAYAELPLKMNRTCQAVAFNTDGLLAVGLDRVRMDQSLHIWDVNRLSTLGRGAMDAFKQASASLTDPKYRLEPSVSISSIKFFEDNPQTLVVGIKSQGLRIHDLREPGSVTTFQTKCNNNLAIDYADANYFASSALDHPGLMVWDRRATSKPVASVVYQQAVDEDDLPWGGALRLDRVIETDSDPFLAEGKHSLIRSLRYCRDHRGLLAVLSRTGQLRVLDTTRETPPQDVDHHNSPELLQVRRSYEMDVSYFESSRKNDRIVSFDWVTLGSPVLQPRLFVLRANGRFDILEQPSKAADNAFKLIPWQPPHRGLEEGTPYQDIMRFEPSRAGDVFGSVLTEKTLADQPVFGPNRVDIESVIDEALRVNPAGSLKVENHVAKKQFLPDAFYEADRIATKLRLLRKFISLDNDTKGSENGKKAARDGAEGLENDTNELSLASDGVGSCSEMHDSLLESLVEAKGLPQDAQSVVDHTMLLRAKEKYLFDPAVNRDVVYDDPWVRFVWDWLADAERSADDGGMVMVNMDLSYLGIYAIWTNDLGPNSSRRLAPGASMPDAAQWERQIGQYCKKRHLPKFDGVSTKKAHHRQICLQICGWGDEQHHDPKGISKGPDPEYPTTIHTMTAARAMFRGDTKQAIQILKSASSAHPELLFVSLALQLIGRGSKQQAKEQLDFDQDVASKTDPYLRAISSLIATGDWSNIANQDSLPLADRAFVAVRNLTDDELTSWLNKQLVRAKDEGDVEGIVLTGITDPLVDIFARHVEKFHDVQTATLVLSVCYPRYIDDIRCRAWRNAYRAYLQRHKLFFQRTKFDVESTKRSKRDGVGAPTITPPSRQIALRCVSCDAGFSLANQPGGAQPHTPAQETRNPLLATSVNAGVSCPTCGRHLPRCVVCLEVVGVPRSDRPEERDETKMAGRFPTFCLKCEHVLHLDHARQWFARHVECPVPECRCRCNFRAHPELNYR